MRFLKPALLALIAVAIVGCSQASNTQTTDQASAAASSAPASEATAGTNEASPAASAAAPAAATMPTYPGAKEEASGSTANMGGAGSAAGKVLSTADAFDKVYAWYQKNMPAGSEKSHTTSPVQSAVFMMGEAGKDQQSVTISTAGGKTMITIAHVKM